MIKKKLKELPELSVTQEMKEVALADRRRKCSYSYSEGYEYTYECHDYYLYLDALVQDGILKVSLFPRKWIMDGHVGPCFDIYISKSENKWTTYDHADDKWREAKIDYLDIDRGYWPRRKENWQTMAARTLVNAYLDTGCKLDIEEAVLRFQQGTQKDDLERRHRRETDAIDAVMNEVPDLPDGFLGWIKSYGFIKHSYLFYDKSQNSCYCTKCRNWMPVSEIKDCKHNSWSFCPKCYTPVRAKSWKKQKYIADTEQIGILQKLNDGTGYVLRGFDCRLTRKQEDGWPNFKLDCFEKWRISLDNHYCEKDKYIWDAYKQTGVIRWCKEKQCYSWRREVVMYTENLSSCMSAEYARVNMKKLFAGDTGAKVDAMMILRRTPLYPAIEYMQKAGLNRLVWEITACMTTKNDKLLNPEATVLTGFLQINKQRLNVLRSINGGFDILRALQYEQKAGQKLSMENLDYIKREQIDITDLPLIRTGLTLQRMLNYLKRQQDMNKWNFRETKRFYIDYLDLAENRGLDIRDEIVCKNSHMREYHNRYLEEKNKKAEDERGKQMDDKYPNIRKDYEQNEKHFSWENKEYLIKVPHSSADIIREGKAQHHCVGASENYMGKMHRRETFILFLREKARENEPYYTLEVRWDGSIIQAYAAYNRKPDYDALIGPLLRKFSKEVSRRTEERIAV